MTHVVSIKAAIPSKSWKDGVLMKVEKGYSLNLTNKQTKQRNTTQHAHYTN